MVFFTIWFGWFWLVFGPDKPTKSGPDRNPVLMRIGAAATFRIAFPTNLNHHKSQRGFGSVCRQLPESLGCRFPIETTSRLFPLIPSSAFVTPSPLLSPQSTGQANTLEVNNSHFHSG
jgi:hypothetical protein